jgi:hypothetical protein
MVVTEPNDRILQRMAGEQRPYVTCVMHQILNIIAFDGAIIAMFVPSGKRRIKHYRPTNNSTKFGIRGTVQTMITGYNCPSYGESYMNITHVKMRDVYGLEIGTVVWLCVYRQVVGQNISPGNSVVDYGFFYVRCMLSSRRELLQSMTYGIASVVYRKHISGMCRKQRNRLRQRVND